MRQKSARKMISVAQIPDIHTRAVIFAMFLLCPCHLKPSVEFFYLKQHLNTSLPQIGAFMGLRFGDCGCRICLKGFCKVITSGWHSLESSRGLSDSKVHIFCPALICFSHLLFFVDTLERLKNPGEAWNRNSPVCCLLFLRLGRRQIRVGYSKGLSRQLVMTSSFRFAGDLLLFGSWLLPNDPVC